MNHVQAKLSTKRPSLPDEDVEAGKKILRGKIDLTQTPVADLLKQLTRNREENRKIHIGICREAYVDLLTAIMQGKVSAREALFQAKLKNDEHGHYLYQYFRVCCDFSPSKSTKLATYLQAKLHEGLDPQKLQERMLGDGWTIEGGYEEVLEDRTEEDDDEDDETADECEDEEDEDVEDEDGDDDDEPKASAKKSKKRQQKTKADEHSIETLGKPVALGDARKSFAIVYYNFGLNIRKIEYLSPNKARDQARRYLRKQNED